MAVKKIVLCSLCIAAAWAYLYTQNNPDVPTDLIAGTFDKLGLGIEIPEIPENLSGSFDQLDSLKEVAEIPDVIERKTNALKDAYEKISASKNQMFDSIQQMKSAANSFQDSKTQMFNDFKDLPTDLLEANSFQPIN